MSMCQDCDRCGDKGVVYTDEDGDEIVPCPECELGEQAMDNPAALWALEVAFWAKRDHEAVPDLPEEDTRDFAERLWDFVQYPHEVTEAAFGVLLFGWDKEARLRREYQAALEWNLEHPVGTAVELDHLDHKEGTRTASAAYVRNGKAVIHLERPGSYWALERIRPAAKGEPQPEAGAEPWTR